MAAPGTIVTGGPSSANPHNSARWNERMNRLYAGTRLGRQELGGELLAELWTVELLEKCRGGEGLAPSKPSPSMGEGWEGVESPEALSGSHRPPHPMSRFGSPRDPKPCPGDMAACSSLPIKGREEGAPPASNPHESAITFTRIVVGVDPPAAGGTCGIVVCAKDREGKAHVLADHSVTGASPERWSRAVADAAKIWSRFPGAGRGPGPEGARQPSPNEPEQEPGAPRRVYPDRLRASRSALDEGKKRTPSIPLLIVAEQNQGGRMVEAILRTADPALKVRPVTAKLSKAERAAPVAMLFEAGRVVLHGKFPELEAELLGIIDGAPYEGPGSSPDRADAMVWALTELMLKKERAQPRVRVL